MSKKPAINIEICDIPALQARTRRQVLRNFPQGLAEMFNQVLREIQSAGSMPTGAPIVLYHDEEYDPTRVDVEVAWPVDDPSLVTSTLPAIHAAARYVHVGPYDQLEKAYLAISEWISANGYRVLCPMREVYPNDPATTPPEELITEVIMPLEKI